MLPSSLLIIDDDQINGKLLQKQFASKGLQADFVDNAKAAVAKLKEQPYEFILTDINMPQVTGIELTIWIKKHYPTSKVVFMTSLDSQELETLALSSGGLQFTQKPVDIDKLYKLFKNSTRFLSGNIQRIGIIELLQILSMDTHHQRLLTIEDKQNKATAKLYLDRGKLIHVQLNKESGSLTGEDAFLEINRLKSGTFSDTPWDTTPPKTIHQDFQALAMDTSRLLDESQAGKTTPLKIRQILVVDDDLLTRKLLQKTLTREGFDVNIAESGKEAQSMLETQKVDLIISDIHMPDMNGIELVGWVREHLPQCPVILMSGVKDTDLKTLASRTGSLRYMSKPVNLKELNTYLLEISQLGFQGYLENVSILEFIQMNIFSGESKRIEIRDIQAGITAWVYMEQGKILHAEYEDLDPENSFYQILAIERGVFFEREWSAPTNPGLQHLPAHKLLMRGMQRIEQNASQLEVDSSMMAAIEAKLGMG